MEGDPFGHVFPPHGDPPHVESGREAASGQSRRKHPQSVISCMLLFLQVKESGKKQKTQKNMLTREQNPAAKTRGAGSDTK